MTMAAAACKQGIILDRLWTALLLVSSKGPREASKLTKRPTDQIFDEKKVPSDFFGKTVFHLGTTSGLVCHMPPPINLSPRGQETSSVRVVQKWVEALRYEDKSQKIRISLVFLTFTFVFTQYLNSRFEQAHT